MLTEESIVSRNVTSALQRKKSINHEYLEEEECLNV